MTMTTEIHLGFEASYEYILHSFDEDERIPHLVAEVFDDIAAEHGIEASLRVYTSSVHISVDELEKLPEDEECFEEWLREAVERVAERWMNDEI